MRDDLEAELVLDALGMAVTTRGDEAAGVAADSDHGSNRPGLSTAATRATGIDLLIAASSATPGKRRRPRASCEPREELLRRERFANREQARLRGFWGIACFYNPRRGTPASARQPHPGCRVTPARGDRGLTLRCQRKRVTFITARGLL